MALKVSNKVERKLSTKHKVSIQEVHDCFANRERGFLEDIREEHKTIPPSQWFIADTDYGRKLKIVFVAVGRDIHIKSAYEANAKEIEIYNKFA
ncbi:hypothetical protein [Pleionea litopenaei]|uniref:Uncharacterized protein n=1 Tax=Pleionea litopenaei TaxID=3070815 RepID=A0AA51X7Z7_9GAMM|nr:hypothetical protein [Pleionea sp. HL-JVS1]WMS88419.1 hypothetical protein Q9312_05760 [Pleionea sp. HL-JVS1]